jgi:PAS domain S-box-containing protein
MFQKKINKIALNLLLRLVFVSSVLTILGTIGQLYLDYRNDLSRVTASLETITSPKVHDISQGVLAGDSFSVNSILDNLLEHSDLAYAAVIVDDKVAWKRGEIADGKHVGATFHLNGSDGTTRSPGRLEVMADTRPIWQQLTHRFTHMLITNGIKMFIITAFMFLMFQYLVTRHLESLAEQIRHLDFSKPFSPLTLERERVHKQDELEQVVCGLNAMQERASKAYESLAKIKKRLLLFFDSTEEAIFGVDRDGVCSFANDACLALLGLDGYEKIVGRELQDVFVHSGSENDNEFNENGIISQTMNRRGVLRCEDGSIEISDGRNLQVSLRSFPVFDGRKVSGAIVFMNDNSETRQLRRERELLSEVVRQVPVLILIADSDNLIQFVNPGVEQLTGYSQQELVGRSLLEINAIFADGDASLSDIIASLQNGRKWEGIIETRSKLDIPLTLYSVVSPVFDTNGKVVNTISVSREISYELGLQNELVNAKKMEAVGRLSASFAHEFGNPLFGVRSVIKDICDRIEFSEEDRHLLGLAQDECERMREMVREFRQVYRDSTRGEEMLSIDRVIKSILVDVSPFMKTGMVDCSLQLAEDIGGVVVSKNKISLVLRNIVMNAIECTGAAGGEIQITSRLDDGYLVVTIEDDGPGIKTDHRELIFEPFFTTKPEVEGAGLGLSIASGIIKSLGGTITFVSKESGGAVFEVHIPVS